MLQSFFIKNILLIDELSFSLQPGFSVVTGESGSGKSAMLKALALLFGERFQNSWIRPGQNVAEVTAYFALPLSSDPRFSKLESILTSTFLSKKISNKETFEENLNLPNLLILTRHIQASGRSKFHLNNVSCSSAIAKELCSLFINVQVQHSQQQLLNPASFSLWLDQFAEILPLRKDVEHLQRVYSQLQNQIQTFEKQLHAAHNEQDFIQYQINELENLPLQDLQRLEAKHQKLSHAKDWEQQRQLALNILSNPEIDIVTCIHRSLQTLTHFPESIDSIKNVKVSLNNSAIELEEAIRALRQSGQDFEAYEEELAQIETTMELALKIARKHRVNMDQLAELHQSFCDKIQGFKNIEDFLEQARQQFNELSLKLNAQEQLLFSERLFAAEKFDLAVRDELDQLGLTHVRFKTQVIASFWESDLSEINNFGSIKNSDVRFEFSANPGFDLQPLDKAASGGELSRLLLIFSLLCESAGADTLIFDEIDAGLSGQAAERLSQLLARLGKNRRVIAITHSPQVAASANHHWCVEKMLFEYFTDVKKPSLRLVAEDGIKINSNKKSSKRLVTLTTDINDSSQNTLSISKSVWTKVEDEERALELIRMMGAPSTPETINFAKTLFKDNSKINPTTYVNAISADEFS
ncbi:MAG: AAA family ATPase [Pseudomonadota bacterium]